MNNARKDARLGPQKDCHKRSRTLRKGYFFRSRNDATSTGFLDEVYRVAACCLLSRLIFERSFFLCVFFFYGPRCVPHLLECPIPNFHICSFIPEQLIPRNECADYPTGYFLR